jgi:hypothetical protein
MRCHEVLDGVGDASLGQWEERGETAWHLRRRLTTEEQASIGPACDLRGTKEAQHRLTNAWRWLPFTLRARAREEASLP